MWEAACLLGDAWFQFAPDDEWDKWPGRHALPKGWRGQPTVQDYENAKQQMRWWLLNQLRARKLQAIGLKVIFHSSGVAYSPVLIPAHFADDNYVNWEKSSISEGLRNFESVRVVPAADMVQSESGAAALSSPKEASGDLATKPMGRPRIDNQLREVVRALHAEGKFAGRLVKEKEAIVGARARELWPNTFPRPSQPSREKVRSALGAEGHLTEAASRKSI